MKLAVLILAGGAGRRMLGRDKGLMPYRGQPLIAHTRRAIAPLKRPVYISANRRVYSYRPYADRIVSDRAKGFYGPLVALADALDQLLSPMPNTAVQATPHAISHSIPHVTHVLVLPCDTPHIRISDVERLINAAKGQPNTWIYTEAGQRTHPLHGVFPLKLLPQLQALVADGERRMMRAIDQLDTFKVCLPATSVSNINHLRQLR